MKQTIASISAHERLSALADPLRLRLLRAVDQQELTVGEIARIVQSPQSTVSRHLKQLLSAGWIAKRTEGTAALYRLLRDDLPTEARAMWRSVRATLGTDPDMATLLAEDDRRLKAVLAQRASDARSFFGRLSGQWDAIRAQLYGAHFTSTALLALIPRHWTVADLGCGTGNGAELLAPHVKRVIALDSSGPMLDAARQRLNEQGNIEFVQGDLEALPLDDAGVDAAICILVLHHLDDPLPALREMRRIIKPGGIALIIDMYPHTHDEYRETMGHAHLGFSEDRVREMYAEAGFKRPSVSPLPADPRAQGPGLFVAIGAADDEPDAET